MILRIFLDEFCKLRRERCVHRDQRYLAKITKKILKIRVYKFFLINLNSFLVKFNNDYTLITQEFEYYYLILYQQNRRLRLPAPQRNVVNRQPLQFVTIKD